MRKVCYQEVLFDDDKITILDCELVDFLLRIPTLFDFGCIPPLRIMNSILLSGNMYSGMGGAMEWKAFSLEEYEYKNLVDLLLLKYPKKFFIDKSFQEISDFEEWCFLVFIKYYKGKQEMKIIAENHYREKFGSARNKEFEQ